jgi:hypothetical protein
MKVCFAIPSKRKPEECQSLLDKWIERGYRVVLRRLVEDAPHPTGCEIILRERYYGWAASVNELSKIILNRDPEVDWIVTGGDDYAPDPNYKANEIANECSRVFGAQWNPDSNEPGTFGVMQPTGDRWGEQDENSRRMHPDAPALIDRICGSPWLGREFCLRMYGGNGPLFDGYKHMFADEELQSVAKRLGVLWQRRDLTQIHHHWSRASNETVQQNGCPDWLQWANSKEHWDASRTLFHGRKAVGFPGYAPL